MTTTTSEPATHVDRRVASATTADGARGPTARGADPLLRVAAVLLGGLNAGFFVTYAISVTTGLALVDDLTYVTAFQAINEAVRTPLFMLVFAAPVPLAFALVALERGRARTAALVAALAFAAVVLITVAGNVPLNEQMAIADATADGAPIARASFEDAWNRLNLGRTIAAVVGFAALVVGGTRAAPATR